MNTEFVRVTGKWPQARRSHTQGYEFGPGTLNRTRLEYAQVSIEAMALEAIRSQSSGTIGVEIPIKDGKLGKVKRLRIDFQQD